MLKNLLCSKISCAFTIAILSITSFICLGASAANDGQAVPLAQGISVNVRSTVVPISAGKKSPAWAFATVGLKSKVGNEIALVVLQGTSKEPPEWCIKFLKGLCDPRSYSHLHEGGLVDISPDTEIGKKFSAAMFMKMRDYGQTSADSGFLATMLLRPEEMAAFDISGPGRVVARLTKQSHYYPYPMWVDLNRPSSIDPRELPALKADMASRTAQLQAIPSTVMLENQKLTMLITKDFARTIGKSLSSAPPNAACSMRLGIDPRANAVTVWHPNSGNMIDAACGGVHASAITCPFIVFVVLPNVATKLNMINDSFFLQLTPAEFARLHSSLSSGQDYSTKLTGAANQFSIVWRNAQQAYLPADPTGSGATPGNASGSLTRSLEIHPIPPFNEKVITTQALSVYGKQLFDSMAESTSKLKGAEKTNVTIKVKLSTEKPVFQISHSSDISPDKIAIEEALAKVAPPTVTEPVEFEVISCYKLK